MAGGSDFTCGLMTRIRKPVPAEPSLILRLPSYLFPTDPNSFFPVARPLELEVGSGDGGFLAQWATLHPQLHFIGIERLLGRLRKLDRKGRRLGLENLRLLRVEASYYLKYLLPPSSLQALHIYFPDPWPKRKHRKHRLINETFPSLAARCLETEGVVYLRTDDEPYFQQMIDVFAGAADFEAVETPSELALALTDFEREFMAQGLSTHRAAYRRR